MTILLSLISALIPAVAMLAYIYWRDRYSPEPISQILKATSIGVLSIPISLCISQSLLWMGSYTNEPTTILQSLGTSFLGAAIPEELAKLCMLWLFLRRHQHFHGRLDGIVYAVCISMGFAAFENIFYVTLDAAWLSVAIYRAIISVPGHFCFAVAMGYFYSLARLTAQNRVRNILLLFITPILLHGIYDFIMYLITNNLSGWIIIVVFLVFCYFCIRMWKGANRAIKKHALSDRSIH